MTDNYDLPTGTYDPPGDSKLIFLAGAITHYWNENWDTPERRAYHAWRQKARYALIEAGYITYAGYEGIKGPWNKKCQGINKFALSISDLFLILSEADIPSKGTEEESNDAKNFGIPIVRCPESLGVDYLIKAVVANLHVP